MMYIVIKYFEDLQDHRYPYNVGDVYPREGLTVTTERIAELSSDANRQHTPLIQAATMHANAVEDTPTSNNTTEDANDSESEEKPKKKGRVKNADKLDVDNGAVQQPE